METSDFFRNRIDTMINLGDPLAVLATRLPWDQIEAALAPMFAHTDRAGVASAGVDLFGPSLAVTGAGRSNAGRPRLPIRLMASLLYLKHSFNLSDEEIVQRWSHQLRSSRALAILQRHGVLRAPAAVRRHADWSIPRCRG